MKFQYNDGGRAAAGFTGSASDCVTRAIAIITERPYAEVYVEINNAAHREKPRRGSIGKKSSARNGVFKKTTKDYLASLGFVWTPTMHIGSGCTVHLRADELPNGRILVAVSRHIVAVIDGVIHDTHDCTRDGMRCVYGYWRMA